MFTEVLAGWEWSGRWRQVEILKYEHNTFYHHPRSQRNREGEGRQQINIFSVVVVEVVEVVEVGYRLE